MAQFDVRRNLNPRTARRIPYLLDVQHGILDRLATRVVVPLEVSADGHAERLNPVFEIDGQRVLMVAQALAAVSSASLGPVVGNLGDHRSEIIDALDFLWCGY